MFKYWKESENMGVLRTCTGLQHIGIPTNNINQTVSFFEKLGFEIILDTINPNNNSKVVFLRIQNTVIETWEDENIIAKAGAIDHIALNVEDIDAAYTEAENQSFEILENEIQFLPFWEKGVRFFTIVGPNGEKIECNQYVK